MRAGLLRHRGTLQKRPAGKDAYGQQSGEWGTARDNIACDPVDLAGRELVTAQAIHAEANVQIVMRGFAGWRNTVKPTMRFLVDGRTLDIKAIVNPDGLDRELRILAKEIVV